MNKQTKKTLANMIVYELGRVTSQLSAINYTTRSVMENIREDASKGDLDSDTVNAELYNLDQLNLIADEIIQSLEDMIVRFYNSSDNENN